METLAKTTCPINAGELRRAAGLIRDGQLVAFPTETVYGLGANALDKEAVARIYSAKGRPATSPLIVHVSSTAMARSLASSWPNAADVLAAAFWPGPLTLVLRKHPRVPDIVTAGLDTVGIRVPAHAVARALIEEAGVPIAAPSANRFSELSPTTAAHVFASLGHTVAAVLDAGPCHVGIESTVLSLAHGEPLLLRPGMVSQSEIESVIGPIRPAGDTALSGAHASPGLHRKHYSPRTPLVIVEGGRMPESGRGVFLCIHGAPPLSSERCYPVTMPADPAAYAACLYSTLHELDRGGWDWIAVERPPSAPSWAGIADRLERAAAK